MDVSTLQPTVQDSVAFVSKGITRAIASSDKAAEWITGQLPEEQEMTAVSAANTDTVSLSHRETDEPEKAEEAAVQGPSPRNALEEELAGQVERVRQSLAAGAAEPADAVRQKAEPTREDAEETWTVVEQSREEEEREEQGLPAKSLMESLRRWAKENTGRNEPIKQGVQRLRESLYQATQAYNEGLLQSRKTLDGGPTTDLWRGIEAEAGFVTFRPT